MLVGTWTTLRLRLTDKLLKCSFGSKTNSFPSSTLLPSLSTSFIKTALKYSYWNGRRQEHRDEQQNQNTVAEAPVAHASCTCIRTGMQTRWAHRGHIYKLETTPSWYQSAELWLSLNAKAFCCQKCVHSSSSFDSVSTDTELGQLSGFVNPQVFKVACWTPAQRPTLKL